MSGEGVKGSRGRGGEGSRGRRMDYVLEPEGNRNLDPGDQGTTASKWSRGGSKRPRQGQESHMPLLSLILFALHCLVPFSGKVKCVFLHARPKRTPRL